MHYVIASASVAALQAQVLLQELNAALTAITGDSGQSSFSENDMAAPGACFVLANTTDGLVVGCGALRPLQPGVAELKRMYARPGWPGLGAALLKYLEQQAQHMAYHSVRLETRAINTRAVRFYERHGYLRIPNYGKYAEQAQALCFEKSLCL